MEMHGIAAARLWIESRGLVDRYQSHRKYFQMCGEAVYALTACACCFHYHIQFEAVSRASLVLSLERGIPYKETS